MKEITLNIYSFGELSEKAKKKAIRDFLDTRDSSWLSDEYEVTLKEFQKIFPVDILNWRIGPYENYIDFRFTEDDFIMDLKGIRLLKYIWNNYRSFLFKPKYFNIPDSVRVTDKKIRHKRLRSEVLKRGPYEGKYYNRYNSAILFENCCTLTGVCCDHDILDPIYNFFK